MVFFVVVAVLTPAALLTLAHQLIRRRAPPVSKVPPGNTLSLEKNGLVNPEDRVALQLAFLTGADFRWLATGKTAKPDENDAALVAWHEKVTSYMIETQLTWSEKHGYILTARDHDTEDFQGAICIIPPIYYGTDNPKWRQTLQHLSSVVPLGKPATMQDSDSHKRFEAFTSTTSKQHSQLLKGTAHWYVALVGVADSAQGKGVGRRLLEQGLDFMGKEYPIYLECHTENIPFYQKMGFEHNASYDLLPKVEGSEDYHYNGMLRPAAAATKES